MPDKLLILAADAKPLIEGGEGRYYALDENQQMLLKESARAMLLALRKPSAAMMRAGKTLMLPGEHQLTEIEVTLIWERMLDAGITE